MLWRPKTLVHALCNGSSVLGIKGRQCLAKHRNKVGIHIKRFDHLCDRIQPGHTTAQIRVFAFSTIGPGHDAFAEVGARTDNPCLRLRLRNRSEEHTSELQSLMRISYAVFCFEK